MFGKLNIPIEESKLEGPLSSVLAFNRNWINYKEGFGDLNTEFWYGLATINCLMQRGQWEMRVDYQKNDKTWSYLHYNQFSVGSASEEYPLTVGGFTGVGMDLFIPRSTNEILNQTKFSTAVNDNDKNSGNCGIQYKNGWWHNRCAYVNINYQPPYYHVPDTVLSTEIKIRLKYCIIQCS